jgi:hypothetical protein
VRYANFSLPQNFFIASIIFRGVFEISQNFRLVALADADSANSTGSTSRYLNDQLLSLFIFHTLPAMESAQELQLISKLVPDVDQKTAEKLIGFVQKLSTSHDAKVILNVKLI